MHPWQCQPVLIVHRGISLCVCVHSFMYDQYRDQCVSFCVCVCYAPLKSMHGSTLSSTSKSFGVTPKQANKGGGAFEHIVIETQHCVKSRTSAVYLH